MALFHDKLALGIALCATACNAPTPPEATGGADLPGGPCGRGLMVVSSDYQSTNVSLTNIDGTLVSSSVVSSASASSALSAPLSGDVVSPNSRLVGDDLVLLDRYPASVLTWVNHTTGEVRAQLDVSTGFAANPRDYLELESPEGKRAYVTRFETNAAPGAEAFDEGGDVLIVDSDVPAIRGRIDLAPAMQDAPGFQPRASRMVRFGDSVLVLLLAYNADFSDAAPSRVVRIDPSSDTIEEVAVLDDLYGCEGLSATSDKVVVSCSGLLAGGNTTSPVGSGVAVLNTALEVQTVMAEDLIGQPLGFSAAATQTGILVTALGAFSTHGEDVPDVLLHVNEDGTHETILETTRPFELGEVRCIGISAESPTCGGCFVTDGERVGLHHLNGNGEAPQFLPLDDGIGLPPRTLGLF